MNANLELLPLELVLFVNVWDIINAGLTKF